MLAFNNEIPPFLELIAAGYAMQFNEYGAVPTGVLWKDAKGQKKRFETLFQMVEERPEKPILINDLGCGYGAMFEYLLEVNFNQGNFQYFGTDICRDMVVDAKKRVSDMRAHFQWAYQVKQLCDYSLLSGTFNMKGTADDAVWTEYVKESLRHLFRHSRKGMGFNLHDANQKKRLEWTFYADRTDMIGFCERELSADVTVIDDSRKKEFTILVRK